MLWALHRLCRGDTVAGECPLQHGAGSWSPLAAHTWKLYAGVPSLRGGETLSVTEAVSVPLDLAP